MSTQTKPPQFPAGPFDQRAVYDVETKSKYRSELENAPKQLRETVSGLTSHQLDTKYKNWTIRQIVHHLADSHVHSYIRFKWALTEDCPVIKSYDESRWSDLVEARTGDIEPSLHLLTGLHERWVQLIDNMSEDDFQRAFVHPETNETISLSLALGYYAWHARHHTGQILWLRDNHDFSQPKNPGCIQEPNNEIPARHWNHHSSPSNFGAAGC